jgi:hypothetical protein
VERTDPRDESTRDLRGQLVREIRQAPTAKLTCAGLQSNAYLRSEKEKRAATKLADEAKGLRWVYGPDYVPPKEPPADMELECPMGSCGDCAARLGTHEFFETPSQATAVVMRARARQPPS